LAPGTSVVRLQRVRLADGIAMSFDETYLPRDIGEKIAENDLEAEPIFALLEGKYDTPLVEAEYKLEASAATSVTAEALQVPQGSPIFLIERTSYTTGKRPVDHERLHYRGDLIRFVTRLARR
jgi:GntR family transcriptional regulator